MSAALPAKPQPPCFGQFITELMQDFAQARDAFKAKAEEWKNTNPELADRQSDNAMMMEAAIEVVREKALAQVEAVNAWRASQIAADSSHQSPATTTH